MPPPRPPAPRVPPRIPPRIAHRVVALLLVVLAATARPRPAAAQSSAAPLPGPSPADRRARGASATDALPSPRAWAGDSLQADVDALGRVLGAFHPALAAYEPRAAFDARLAALRATFAGPVAPADAVRRFAQFVTALRDGHTFLNPYNQGAFVRDTVLGGATRLPFTARVLAGASPRAGGRSGDALVVTRDLTGDGTGTGALPPGTVVRALGGVPVAAVLDSLQTVSRGDGHTDALRRARLGVRDDQAAARLSDAPLDLYYARFYPPVGDELPLTVRRPGAARDTAVTVRLVTHEERRTRLARQDSAAGGVRWRARRLDARTAVITVPSFVTYGDATGTNARSAPSPTRWLDSALAALHADGVDRLVVDVRGNVGGSTDLAYALARRLTARWVRDGAVGDGALPKGPSEGRVLPCDAIERVLVASPTPDTVAARFASSWRDEWKRPLRPGTWRRAADGRAELVPDAEGAWPVYGRACETAATGEAPFAWPGRAAVLADEANASATFLFLTLVRRHALAPIVGRPAGGNQRGINGGLVLFTQLPYSRIEVDVPFFAQEPRDGPRGAAVPDAALSPDVPVAWTAADVATGRDPDVAAARRLLAGPEPRRRPRPAVAVR